MLHSIAFEASETLALGLNQPNLVLHGKYVAFPEHGEQPTVYRIHEADADWNPGEMVATGFIGIGASGEISIS